MHATLTIHIVFDNATVDGNTPAEKAASIEGYLTTLAEQVADTLGNDSVFTGYNSVDEVTHTVEVKHP